MNMLMNIEGLVPEDIPSADLAMPTTTKIKTVVGMNKRDGFKNDGVLVDELASIAISPCCLTPLAQGCKAELFLMLMER